MLHLRDRGCSTNAAPNFGKGGPMHAERDYMADLLRQCETRLVDTLRVLGELLDAVRRTRRLSQHGVEPPPNAVFAGIEPGREAMLTQILTALEPWSGDALRPRASSRRLRLGDEGVFYIGERRLPLSDTEARVLGALWEALPEPVSREAIFTALYPRADKPSMGVIDVFMSKLRQKLKLASDGGEYIVSIRGKGWSLHGERCQRD
jgi:two-component system cell cycle response regulator CtrA